MDKETGLYCYPARYYDSRNVKFMTLDPSGIELMNPMQTGRNGGMVPKNNYDQVEGLNWYSYCGNNPVMYSDPTGMAKIWHNGKFPGWTRDAWHHKYGCFVDAWNNLDFLIGFNVHAGKATGKFLNADGKSSTIIQMRFWKGNYTGMIGGELTFHTSTGRALSEKKMSALGIKSVQLKVFSNRNITIGSLAITKGKAFIDHKEDGSFTSWINAYAKSEYLIVGFGKNDIYSEVWIELGSFDQAQSWADTYNSDFVQKGDDTKNNPGAENYSFNFKEKQWASAEKTKDGKSFFVLHHGEKK